MNKIIKNMSALFLALAVFTVNIPLEMVSFSKNIGLAAVVNAADADKYVEILPGDISFSVEADSTGSSTVIFKDETFTVALTNKSANNNVKYTWSVSPDGTEFVQSDTSAGSTITFPAPGDITSYEIFVEGDYYYVDPDDTTNTEVEKTVESGKFTVTTMERPDIVAEIAPLENNYAVDTLNLNDIYVEINDSFSLSDTKVEWNKSSGLTGIENEETNQYRFNFEPNVSITEKVGTYTLSADVYYDHDGDGNIDAWICTTKDATITIYDNSSKSVNIESSSGTEFYLTSTGTTVLTANLNGLSESDLIGEDTGYLWTLGDETVEGETGGSLTLNISNLSTTQTYNVKVSYLDEEGSVQTLTDSITLTRTDGSSSGDSDDGSGDSGTDDDSSSGGQTGDGSAYPQLLSDLSIASKVYVQNREASPLTVSVDPRIDGTISYKWYVNTAYSTVGGTLLNYEYGIAGNTTSITPSVTPSTATVGTFYYYVEVTNHYGEYTKTTRSNIATIQVISDDAAPTKYTVSSDGNLEVADYSKIVVDWSTFDEFIDNGGEVLNVTGAYIQNLRVPAVYSSNGYEVHVTDTGYDLEYTWKIKDGSKVSGYLDLALSTATSLSGVDKGNSALNYDARYSQIIEFKHEGALTTNDKGITLSMPTTVKDGDGHLNKINDDSTINYNSYVKGSIENGLLTVNMKECSNWVVSALKLAALSDYDNTDGTGALTGFVNIPTFVGFEISEFKNVVVGQMIYLDKINMDTIENNRFSGWYYDTAFLEPVSTSDVSNGMLVTREIVTNGLYPKYDKTNSYVPAISTPVPSTGNLYQEINLKALF